MPDRSVAYIFKGNFANLTAGLTTAGRNVTELGTKLTALDKDGAKMRAGLTQVGATAGKIGLIAAAGLTVAIGAAARFDKAMSSVQAATHETTSNMEDLRAAAIKAGADTSFSASEAAGAIEELAKAGVSTADILGGGLTGSLNLAAAGSLEVGDAAEYAATAMTQFKLGGDQVEHVADLLAAGAGKAQGEVSDLGMALKQSGLVAAQTGLSIEETVGTLSAFASAGLLGSDSGTSFKTMLQSLTPTGKKAADEMDRLGISAYDAQGNFVGITDFAGQLQEGLRGLSVEQQNAAMKIIFGSDAVRAASVLFQQGATGIQGWIDKTNDSGYAADTAGIKLDNLAGDFEKLKGSLETALIGAGDGSQGPLRSLVQGADSAVNAFNGLSPAVQSSATALLGITAVTGGALWFGSKVVNGISDTRAAMDALGFSSGKTGKALGIAGRAAGAAGVAFAGLAIIDQLQNKFDGATIGIEGMAKALLDIPTGAALPEDLDGLANSIDRLADPNKAQALQDSIATVIGFGGGSEWGNAKSDIEAIDAALSKIVATNGVDVAAESLSALAEKAGLSKGEVEDLKNLLPQYKDAIAGASNATVVAADSVQTYGTAARTAEQATAELDKAIEKSRDSAQKQAQAFFNLGDSINDTKVSLSDWIADMREQADALRNFRVNAEQAADKGLRQGLIKALQEAGPEGALRMKQLANATDAEIKKANGAWQAGQREIRKYTDAVGGVPSTAGTTVSVKTFDAMTAIARLKLALAQVKSKDVSVNVHYMNIGNKLAGMAAGSADGGSVPKGGAYFDKHLYMLAPGEEIISNRHGQADQFRSDRALGRIPGYADGGTTGGGRGIAAAEGTITRASSVSDAVAAIVELRGSLRGLNADIRESDKTIKRETRERDLAADAASKAQAEVDRLNGLYSSLSSSIQAGLAANQFEQGDPWKSTGGIAGILEKLTASTADANAMTTATTAISGSLTGAALQSVLEQGSATTQMFAGLSQTDLAAYQAAFDTNAAAIVAAGTGGGQAVYGQDMEKANQIAAASEAHLAQQTVELQTANRQRSLVERHLDTSKKELGNVKDVLGEIRDYIKKATGDLQSAQRSKR